jgi:hypothetical protein
METPSDASPGEPADLRDAVVRDDSGDLAALFDLLRDRRRAGGRAKLIDSGKLGTPDLERLAEAGMDIFSSDAVRTDAHGLVLIGLAARNGGSSAAYFVHGPFRDSGDTPGISFDNILELARTGMRIAVSNGRVPREAAALDRLADACRKGGTRLVYYHAGPADDPLVDLCRAGVWLHLDAAAQDPAGASIVGDCARAALAAGGGLVLHVSEPIDPDAFADFFGSGAFILFHTPPADYRDPRRALEERAKARPLLSGAFYLFSGFML